MDAVATAIDCTTKLPVCSLGSFVPRLAACNALEDSPPWKIGLVRELRHKPQLAFIANEIYALVAAYDGHTHGERRCRCD